MNFKSIGLTLAAGLATFLIVTIAVAAFIEPWIEFSLFVGIPAGLVTGAVAAALVALGFGDDAPAQRRRLAISFAAFAAGFLVVLVVGSVANLGISLLILAGVGVGILAALGTYLREPKPKQPQIQA